MGTISDYQRHCVKRWIIHSLEMDYPLVCASFFFAQVLLLVVGRWLVGWCFPRRDLEILDDPIPEAFYCRKYCKLCEEDSDDVESGILGDTDGLVDDKHAGESHTRSRTSDAHAGQLEGLKAQSKINITEEVDHCELWRHMVRSLDKEPDSPLKCKRSTSHEADGDLKHRAAGGHQLEFSTKELEAVAGTKESESTPDLIGYHITEI